MQRWVKYPSCTPASGSSPSGASEGGPEGSGGGSVRGGGERGPGARPGPGTGPAATEQRAVRGTGLPWSAAKPPGPQVSSRTRPLLCPWSRGCRRWAEVGDGAPPRPSASRARLWLRGGAACVRRGRRVAVSVAGTCRAAVFPLEVQSKGLLVPPSAPGARGRGRGRHAEEQASVCVNTLPGDAACRPPPVFPATVGGQGRVSPAPAAPFLPCQPLPHLRVPSARRQARTGCWGDVPARRALRGALSCLVDCPGPAEWWETRPTGPSGAWGQHDGLGGGSAPSACGGVPRAPSRQRPRRPLRKPGHRAPRPGNPADVQGPCGRALGPVWRPAVTVTAGQCP